jgi:hypothetical protein
LPFLPLAFDNKYDQAGGKIDLVTLVIFSVVYLILNLLFLWFACLEDG